MHSVVVSKRFTKTHLFAPTLIFFNRLLFREVSKSQSKFLFPPTTYSLVTPKAEIFLIAEAIFTISVGFSKTQIKYLFFRCFICLIFFLIFIPVLYQRRR